MRLRPLALALALAAAAAGCCSKPCFRSSTRVAAFPAAPCPTPAPCPDGSCQQPVPGVPAAPMPVQSYSPPAYSPGAHFSP